MGLIIRGFRPQQPPHVLKSDPNFFKGFLGFSSHSKVIQHLTAAAKLSLPFPEHPGSQRADHMSASACEQIAPNIFLFHRG